MPKMRHIGVASDPLGQPTWLFSLHLPSVGWLFLVAFNVSAQTLEVFTDQQHPVTGMESVTAQGAMVIVYDFDAPRELEATLSEGLSADPETAAQQARARLQTLGIPELRRHAETAHAGPLRALELGLARYPAIVIDGVGVVYGSVDLEAIWPLIDGWRMGRTP